MKHCTVQSSCQETIGPEKVQHIRDRVYDLARQLDVFAHIANDDLYGHTAVTEKRVLSILSARRRRAKFFDADLFADPAWDILLELYAAELAQRRMTVNQVCIGAAVPPTTALRWINMLEQRGMILRRSDPMDGRRAFLSLSPTTTHDMEELLRSLPLRDDLL
jgi:DNA-binding MarR family transcriptional regulator